MNKTIKSDNVCKQTDGQKICSTLRHRLHQEVDLIANHCETSNENFLKFEATLIAMMMQIGSLFVVLFLNSRHYGLELTEWLTGEYRIHAKFAERTIKTSYGPVTYGRAYLLKIVGKEGFFPLDVVLGLTRDGFSPFVISLSSRLSTRLSFGATAMVFKYFMEWSPSTEAIECFVLGLGRYADGYTMTSPPPDGDGEMLVIEVDGKATPTATDEELAKRRGERKKTEAGQCKCKRHRGRVRRTRAKRKKRRKPGDKSKNGRSITLVAIYTLRRGDDGRLHGPINKRIWGTYAPRQFAIAWARDQATKRGFPPDTDKTVQIIVDGEVCLRQGLKKLFKNAIFTLDIRHVQERLWTVGRAIFPGGGDQLHEWVEDKETMLFEGDVSLLLASLKELYQAPGGKDCITAQREALEKIISYIEPRLDMMRYADMIKQDMNVASGVVEGAARYVVGERMDCSGMRWIEGRAEALLHLRCLELNGEWDAFFDWAHQRWQEKLYNKEKVQIRTNDPILLPKAA